MLMCATLMVYFAYTKASLILMMIISGTTCYYLVE
jgi:hypothetical protein